MATQNVVDELVVKLTLDATDYKKSDKQISGLVDQSEKKAVTADSKRKKRETEQIKRNKEHVKSTKSLSEGLEKLSTAMSVVAGAAVATIAATVSAITGLNAMDVSLRRLAVGTGLSTRQMQAWGSTGQRVGADATGFASALADLAKEQNTMNMSGSAPTQVALSRMGVHVGANVDILDMLSEAQQRYRAATPGQKTQDESLLVQSGVSPDLIIAIKSETNIREAYNKSLQQASAENVKAMAATADALAALKSGSIAVATALTSLAAPAINTLAIWANRAAATLSKIADDSEKVGGGLRGLDRSLSKNSSAWEVYSKTFDLFIFTLQTAVHKLEEWVGGLFGHVVKNVKNLSQGNLYGHSYDLGKSIGNAASNVYNWIGDKWTSGTTAADNSIFGNSTTSTTIGGNNTTGGKGNPSMQELVNYFVQQGLPVNEAIGLATNAKHESGLRADAVGSVKTSQGYAKGLFQWLSKDRIAAFVKQYGTTPEKATWQQQAQFVLTDPYERARLDKSLGSATTAGDYGYNISKGFESHGIVAEDLKRGQDAQSYATMSANNQVVNAGSSINIQTVNIQADNPSQLVGGLQRVVSPQNYNASQR